jgi:hypothetical protein
MNAYPALYRSADVLSLSYQRTLFRAVCANLSLSVLGAILSALNSHNPTVALVQALSLLGALGCAIYLFAAKPDRYWYAARAVAESIKTATWRFISVAEPFNHSHDEDRAAFRNMLRAIVTQNRDVAQRLTRFLDELQITSEMLARRDRPLEERLASYLDGRVIDQQKWYAKKAAHNQHRATVGYIVLIVVNGLAVAFSIARIQFVEAKFWPTDIWIAAGASIVAWLQAKRFSELASSYSLAAHEISLIREQSAFIRSESEFSRFVGDAENAFSREHTQWVAKKDE